MMYYPITTICSVVGGKFLQQADELYPQHLVYDSRRIQQASQSLFFALISEHADGHRFVADAYRKGVRNFIVSKEQDVALLPEANVISVSDTLVALQDLAAFH